MPMADDAGKQNPPSLDEFSKRLDAVRGDKTNAESSRAGSGQAMGRAFRVASELLAAMIVGVLLGLGADKFLGISPFGLLAGALVGFAAGVMNVARAMKNMHGDSSEGG